MMKPPPGHDPDGPYPSVRGALMLTLMALVAAGFTGIAFMDFGLLAAVGIGQAIGVGAVATMGAQRVAEPQAERLGLRALDLRAIPMILCLVPAILLASELDNFAADWSGSPGGPSQNGQVSEELEPGGSSDADYESAGDYDRVPPRAEDPLFEPSSSDPETAVPTPGDEFAEVPKDVDDEEEKPMRLIDPDDPASVLQAFVVIVGISPIVEEFLFRGVIQQGLLQRLGLFRGLSMVALLWTLLRPAPLAGFTRFLAAALASFALGWALGLVRIATGSILGPILLASSWAAIGLSATLLQGKFDLPGLNVAGSHLPVLVSLASLVVVGWAGRVIFEEAEARFGDEGTGSSDGPTSGPTNVTDLTGKT